MEQKPSPDLYNRVINRINNEHKLLVLKRLILSYFLGFSGSLGAFIFLASRFSQDVSSSGLGQFLSLFFSDFSMVVSNMGDFFWVILESIPAASFAFTLLALVAFVFSLVKFLAFLKEFQVLRKVNAN